MTSVAHRSSLAALFFLIPGCGGRVAVDAPGDGDVTAREDSAVGREDTLPPPFDAGHDVSAVEIGDPSGVACGPAGTESFSGSLLSGAFSAHGGFLSSVEYTMQFGGSDVAPYVDRGFLGMWSTDTTASAPIAGLAAWAFLLTPGTAGGPGVWSCAHAGRWIGEPPDYRRTRWELDGLATLGSCADHAVSGTLEMCHGSGSPVHTKAAYKPGMLHVVGAIDGVAIDEYLPTGSGAISSFPGVHVALGLQPWGFFSFTFDGAHSGGGFLVRPDSPTAGPRPILCFGDGEAWNDAATDSYEIVARTIGSAGTCPAAPGTATERGCGSASP